MAAPDQTRALVRHGLRDVRFRQCVHQTAPGLTGAAARWCYDPTVEPLSPARCPDTSPAAGARPDEGRRASCEGRIHRDEGRPVTWGELLLGLQDASRLAEEQRTRERIAKERREAHDKARERFSGSLHVEDLEGDLKRTWQALKARTRQSDSISLSDVANEMNRDSILQGLEEEEAITESQVTAFVSTLFLTNRGYISLGQESG